MVINGRAQTGEDSAAQQDRTLDRQRLCSALHHVALYISLAFRRYVVEISSRLSGRLIYPRARSYVGTYGRTADGTASSWTCVSSQRRGGERRKKEKGRERKKLCATRKLDNLASREKYDKSEKNLTDAVGGQQAA